MLAQALLAVSLVYLCHGDVSHLSSTTEAPPPRPYAFAYTAGRFPGQADRHHAEVSDGSGVVRGTYSYVDPRQQLRRVDYVADKQGFHPIVHDAPPDHPADTAAVAQAKDLHHALYEQIAASHAGHPFPEQSAPRQSAAVAAAAAKHATLFRVIAEQHARIAAEREALQLEEEDKGRYQELRHMIEEYRLHKRQDKL